MKRDMDLWRKLLFMVRDMPLDSGPRKLTVPDYDELVVDYHLLLLKEKSYIVATVANALQRSVPFVRPERLTVIGHELVEMMEDDTVWNKAKKEVATRAGTITLDMVVSILIQIVKGSVGLP